MSTTVFDEHDGLATVVEIDDDLDDAPDGGWGAVETLFHVGKKVPAKAIASAMPRLRRFSTWYVGDHCAEHARATVTLAERMTSIQALDVHVEPSELEAFAPLLASVPPRVTELGLRIAGVHASALAPWLALPALARPTLRFAINRDLAGFTEILSSGVLASLSPAVSTVEVSFDFGLRS